MPHCENSGAFFCFNQYYL